MDSLTLDMEFLRELTEKELEQLLEITETHDYAEGDVIVRQGAPVDAVYVLLDGVVRVSAILAANEAKGGPDEEVLVRLKPGEPFGELSFITGENPNLSVIAEAPSKVAAISRAKLYELIAVDASICRKLLFAFTRLLVARLRETGRELVLTRYFLRAE